MYDTIIIGAGPAGLTAALYLLRAKKNILILEKNVYGGQIINASIVENYPGMPKVTGYDFANNLYNQVIELGGKVTYEAVLKINKDKEVITNKNTYKAKTIIIASGSSSRKINIDREKDFVGNGLSYCAICDGNLYKNKDVAVVGGGNTALEDALYLSNIVKNVYIIHRRDSFSGENKYIDELKEKDNVKFIFNSNVTKLNGNDKLESIDIVNDKNEVSNIIVSGLFVAIGQEPKNEIFADVIDIDGKGYIISKDGIHTNVDKILVAGDARVKNLRQLTTAVGDGALCAFTAIREMNK